jgi:hypothetical protein
MFSSTNLAVDVLQHDDRVVHHEPDGQHQGQQREHVDREAHRVHHEERPDQCNRHHDQRNERRPPVAEEEKNDEDDQQKGQNDRLLDLVDAIPDGFGVVEADAGLQVAGQVGPDVLDPPVKLVDDVDVVGAGKRAQDHPHHRRRVALEERALVERGDLGPPHVLHPHGLALLTLFEDERIEVVDRLEAALRAHGELDRFPLDAPRRQLDIRPVQRIAHVEGGEVVGRELLRIEPEAHGEGLLPPDVDPAHPVDRL